MRGLLLLALVGCSTDVCAPFDGQTCVALELRSAASLSVDRVGVAIDGVLSEQLSPANGPLATPLQLPLAIAVLTGDPANDLTLRVRALLNGVTLAQAASTPITLGAGQHFSAVMDLLPVPTDFGSDLTPSDLASIDLASTDFSVTDFGFDFANPSDLAAAPDLLPAGDLAQFCQLVTVSTLSGDGTAAFLDGPFGAARFHFPNDVAADTSGNLYVADAINQRIRKIAPDGTTSTLAGNGTNGFVDGTGGPSGTTEFDFPTGIAVDGGGNVYVSDGNNSRIRKVAPDGTTSTLAGNGTSGFADGTGTAAGTSEFNEPQGLALDGLGFLYVADSSNRRIRKLASDGTTVTFSGNGANGVDDGTGGATGSTSFELPFGIAIDGSGSVYVADFVGHEIRKLAPNGSSTTLSGNLTPGTTDGTGGMGGTARFSNPTGLALDANGNLYVTDNDDRIRRVAPDGSTLTVTGSVGSGFHDGGGCTAQFSSPKGLALFGNLLYVADSNNQRIRVVQLP